MPDSTTATAAPGVPPAPGAWHSVFDERFAGDSLDGTRWVTCYDWNDHGCTNAGNHELEWYEPGQVEVGGGVLTLTAQRRTVVGSTGATYPWVSGMASTGRSSSSDTPHFAFTYGYVSADIKLSRASGIYPAFWLLPADKVWPPEIDILESSYPQDTAQFNVHFVGPVGNQQAQYFYGPGDFAAGYHDFAVDWEPGRITWYVDGVPRYTVANGVTIPHGAMEILFTLAVGIPGAPPPDTTSATMSIKDVHVWQH